MTQRITPGQIKKNNRQQIYNTIYQEGSVSQQNIAYALRLSRPTVSANLAELEADGLIVKSGQMETDQIGRKAAAYSVVPDYRVAVGVEFMRGMVKLIAVDLYGRNMRREVLQRRFLNEPGYYQEVCGAIAEFIEDLGLSKERVLGVGLGMQGLASADGRTLVYGAILGCTGLKIDQFEEALGLPCRFVHDSVAAAQSELWVSPELTNAIYLSISRHLGGALILNRRIIEGKHGHAATFEHIQARPRGAMCYCGKRGCWDTLLSMRTLLGEESADAFFEAVRSGESEAEKRWSAYLRSLAQLIALLHLNNDVDYILGGHLAPYFTESDIRFLYREISQICPFEEEDDFIRISKMPSHNINIGLALDYIRAFLEDIDSIRG